jgi:hypothetical protein
LIEKQETEAMAGMLAFVKKMEPEEIDSYINLSVEKGTVEITNRLIEYQNKLYPIEKVFEMQNEEMEKAIGIREKTLADYRKEFKIVKGGDCYVITGYKSENPGVIIPGKIKDISVKIDIKAFLDCNCIQSVYIDEGVTEIRYGAFYNCKNLESITIPGSLTETDGSICYGCVNLKNVTLAVGLKKIGDWTFSLCTRLQNILIPEGVIVIGYRAFEGCESLQSITIPDSVTNISESAFRSCPNVTIYAPAGSYAEQYANENHIKFQAI